MLVGKLIFSRHGNNFLAFMMEKTTVLDILRSGVRTLP
jgi:hypothetical protein